MRRSWLPMAAAIAVTTLVGAGLLSALGTPAATRAKGPSQATSWPWLTTEAIEGPGAAATTAHADAPPRQALLSPQVMRLIKDALGGAEGQDRPARIAHARSTLRQQVPAHLHTALLNLFDRYVAYQDALLAGEAPREGDLAAWRRHLGTRDALRRAHFSQEEIVAFWEGDARAEANLLGRMAVLATPGMSDAEREAAMQQIEAQSFGPAEAAARRASVQPLEALQQTDRFNAQQVSAEERFAARAQALGSDAAQRLAQLDQQDAEWQRKLDLYAQAPKEEQAALAQSLFTDNERRRLDGAIALRKQGSPGQR